MPPGEPGVGIHGVGDGVGIGVGVGVEVGGGVPSTTLKKIPELCV